MTKLLMTVFAMITLTTAGGSFVAQHSGASLVKADALGGRVELHGAYAPAMSDARNLMSAHCGGSVELVEHGSAVDFRCGEGDVNTAAARIELTPAQGTRG